MAGLLLGPESRPSVVAPPKPGLRDHIRQTQKASLRARKRPGHCTRVGLAWRVKVSVPSGPPSGSLQPNTSPRWAASLEGASGACGRRNAPKGGGAPRGASLDPSPAFLEIPSVFPTPVSSLSDNLPIPGAALGQTAQFKNILCQNLECCDFLARGA
jgi:hypothetical protein